MIMRNREPTRHLLDRLQERNGIDARDQGPIVARGGKTISRAGLFRHRSQATRQRSAGALEFDVSFLPTRKRAARRTGHPLWRRTLCANVQAMLHALAPS